MIRHSIPQTRSDAAGRRTREPRATCWPHRLVLLGLVVALALGGALGCEEDELEPTDPEGAFQLFAEALQERDAEEVWEYLDKDTKQLFTERYRALVRMDRIIEAYFDPAEHRDMRKRTGAYILDEAKIDSPQKLYRYTFDLTAKAESGNEEYAFSFDEDEEVGMDIDEFKYNNEEEDEATIKTRGGQTFIMVKGEDEIWRTASLWGPFSEALDPIAKSEAALKEYAKENLIEERERRLDVIEYFHERLDGNAPAEDEGDEALEGAAAQNTAAPEDAPPGDGAEGQPSEDTGDAQ